MHELPRWTYPVTTPTERIAKDVDDYVRRNSDYGGGLYSPIQFINRNVGTYEQANAYIDKIDKDYGQFAVKYTEPTETKKMKELGGKANEAFKKYSKASSELHVEKITSEFIGCKECGSRLARKHLRSNFCPLCRADLRSPTELKRIENLKTAYEKALKAFNDEKEKVAKKGGKEMWLVKFEYHC